MRKILTFCAFVCAACCAFASGKSVAKVDDSMVFPDLIIDCTFEAWGEISSDRLCLDAAR